MVHQIERRWKRSKGLVLIADRDMETREVLSRALELDGFQVMAVENGVELAAYLQADLQIGRLPASVEAIVAEAMMPGVSGVSLLDGLHALGVDIPFVLTVDRPGLTLQNQLHDCSPSAILLRPFAADDLREVLAIVMADAASGAFQAMKMPSRNARGARRFGNVSGV